MLKYLTKKQKSLFVRILVALALFTVLLIVEKTEVLWFLKNSPVYTGILIGLAVAGYLTAGYDVLLKAGKNIIHGHVFDENFLMTIATFGAFFIGDYTEVVAVMLFYQVGELFQSYAVGKSRESISALMSIAPEYANVMRDGEITKEDPEDVQVGEMIIIRPGEKVPLDGIVRQGASMLDTSSLTGESVPRSVRIGDPVISGCMNGSGTLVAEVTKVYEESTVARILELVENASMRKAKTENFITRFAKYYTPFVTVSAVLLAVIPPLFFNGAWSEWIGRACTFLVISCPCALVISVPLGFFGGIGSASKHGVLVKGSSFLEALSEVRTIVFDKTGTLTKGEFKVNAVCPEGISEDAFLEIAAHLESFSTHPIGEALRAAWLSGKDEGKTEETTGDKAGQIPEAAPPNKRAGRLDPSLVTAHEEIPGQGISADFKGKRYLIGNEKLMKAYGIETEAPEDRMGTVTYLAVLGDGPDGETYAALDNLQQRSGQSLGYVLISDTIKDNEKEALNAMKEAGARRLVMLTGDRREAAEAVAKKLSVDEVFSDLLPGDKVKHVEDEISALAGKGKVAFAGDGINDAPVIMRADLGLAMGSLGSDAAIEAADIVLMDDDLSKIASTMRIAKKTVRIVNENIILCLGIKGLALLLGAFGIVGMWFAVFADVGVCVIAILNSMRALFQK